MGFMGYVFVAALLIFGNLFLAANCENSGSVIFIDGPSPRYLRPSSGEFQDIPISPSEVGAVVSVLLGFNPTASLSQSGSSKLNEVLMPNPFERPRAVMLLEVSGVDDSFLIVGSDTSIFKNFHRRKKLVDLEKTQIELPSEEAVVVAFTDPTDGKDNELVDFVSWFGGTYDQNGQLIFPLAGGNRMELDVSKKVDREFVTSLVTLWQNFESFIELHEGSPYGIRRPAELMMGCFDGLKILRAHHASNDVLDQGYEVFLVTLSKLFTSMQAAYRGNLIGVVLLKNSFDPKSENLINVIQRSYSSVRQLAETNGSLKSTNATIAATALVRSTLAWVTGIILLLSTLLGIYLLLSMPLTRDTLLYSNVKLD